MPEIKERPILFSAPMVRAILEGRKMVTRRAVNPQPVLTEGSGFSWKGHLFGSGSDDRETARNFSKHCCTFGKPGDRLWVRETWGVISHDFDEHGNMIDWNPDRPATPIREMRFGQGCYSGHVIYRADGEAVWAGDDDDDGGGDDRSAWKPSIHMPRIASRILLEITDVRVERLQDISEGQARAEGIIPVPKTTEDSHQFWRNYHLSGDGTFCVRTPKESFKSLWCHVAGGSFPKGEAAYKASPHSWDANPWVWVVEFKQVTPRSLSPRSPT
jgi:hypothetical protein